MKVQHSLRFILFLFLGSPALGFHLIHLFTQENNKGDFESVDILKQCSNLEKTAGLVNSLDTRNACARLYDAQNCTGVAIEILPWSPTHNNMTMRGFANRTRSVGPCLNRCDKRVTGELPQNGKPLDVILYKDKDFKSHFQKVRVSGCTKVPPEFHSGIRSINTSNSCIQLYTNANCNASNEYAESIELRPGTPFHNDLYKWAFFHGGKSLSHCSYKCRGRVSAKSWIWISTLALVVVLSGMVAFLWWRGRKLQEAQKYLLSKDEFNDFRYGSVPDENFLKDNNLENNYQFLKFPKECEIPKANFKLQNVLGKGNFGVVHKATLAKDKEGEGPVQEQVAVKIPHAGSSKESFRSILTELKLMSYIGSHPHVVDFKGAYVQELRKGIAFIALELCENGSLEGHLRKLQTEVESKKGEISYQNVSTGEDLRRDRDLERFSYEIALGMEYISNRKVIHGDLSTRNVLLDYNFQCKIGDFGLSRKLYEYERYVKENQEPLPWKWMAVESLKRLEFTTKSDVWSYGVTVWEIFSLGSVPYPGRNWTVDFVKELEAGLRMESPTLAPEAVYKVMMKCWSLNPDDRPSFTKLAQLLSNYRDSKYLQISED